MLDRRYFHLFPERISILRNNLDTPAIFPNKGHRSFVIRQGFVLDAKVPGFPAFINCCGERHVVHPSKDWASLVFLNHPEGLDELKVMETFGDEKSLRCLVVARAWKEMMIYSKVGGNPEARKLLPPPLRRAFDFRFGKKAGAKRGRKGGIENTIQQSRWNYCNRNPDRLEKGQTMARIKRKLNQRCRTAKSLMENRCGIGLAPDIPGEDGWREEIYVYGFHRALLSDDFDKQVLIARASFITEDTARVLVCWPLGDWSRRAGTWDEDPHPMTWGTAKKHSATSHWSVTIDKERGEQ